MASYQPQSEDTHPDIDRMVFERLRSMSPAERLGLLTAACASVEQVSLAGLRHRHPDAPHEELLMRAAALRVGRETMLRFFGERALAWLP